MGGSIFLTLFFGVFIAIGVGILGFGLRSLHLAQQAEHWPTVPGKVRNIEFDIDSDSDGTTYKTKVSYLYNVMGREIAGTKIAFGYAGSSSEQFHRDIYSALPVNTQVAVRYNPNKPDQAVLSFGVNQSIKFLILFGAVWCTFVFGLMTMMWMSGQGATTLLDNMIIYSKG